VEDQ